MINNGFPGEDSDPEKRISGSLDNSPKQSSTPKKMENSSQSPKKQAVSTDESESSIASASDEEWKPSILKKERIIDPEKIIEIKTAEEPLFAEKEIVEISDYDDDEDKDNSPGINSNNKLQIDKESNNPPAVSDYSPPSKNPLIASIEKPLKMQRCDVSVPQTIKKSGEPLWILNSSQKNISNSNTGAIKKQTSPILSSLKPINVSENKDAARVIRKLVEYFTFHNSLPDKEKQKQKHKLSEEFMAVFSDVVNECCNNIFISVLESDDYKNKKEEGKKVKTKNVATQTVVSGNVLASNLLTETKGKNNDENGFSKTDMETVIDLFNEYIVKMSVTKNAE